MSELDFPELDTAAPVASTAVAEQPAGAVDLTKLDLQVVALAQFNASHAAAKTAREKLDGVVHDLSTPTKLADAKSLRHRLIGQPLAEARKVSAGLKSKLTAVSRAVGAELESVEAAFQKADALISPQIAKREEDLAEERRIAEQKEAARVQAHRDNLAKLAGYVEFARGLPSGRIADGIAKVSAISIEKDAWEDFYEQALKQKADTLASMQKLHDDALADEERARAAAALKAEEERLAAERAEIERQKAELAAQQQAAAEAKAREEAEKRAASEREAAAEREAARVAALPLADRVKHIAGRLSYFNAAEGAQWDAERGARNLCLADFKVAVDQAIAEGVKVDLPGELIDPAIVAALKPETVEMTTTEQGSQQVLKAEAPAPEASDRDAPASTSPSVGSMGEGQPADAGPAAGGVRRGYIPFGATRTAPLPEALEQQMLKLGELWDILGLSDREAFLAGLGFRATPAAKGTAKLYAQASLPSICMRISEHFATLAAQKKAA